jgi:hypothetical protein
MCEVPLFLMNEAPLHPCTNCAAIAGGHSRMQRGTCSSQARVSTLLPALGTVTNWISPQARLTLDRPCQRRWTIAHATPTTLG